MLCLYIQGIYIENANGNSKEPLLKPYKRPFITGLILIAATVLISTAAAAGQTEKTAKVAVLPFKINSEKNLDFLQDGIMDMLSSRLAWQGKVEVLEKEYVKDVLGEIEGFTGQSRALMAGAKLQADYVLYGSVTILGSNASIDAKLLDVAGKNEVLPFSRQAQGLGNVIPQINRFATNINETVFNRRTSPRQFASGNQQQQQQPGKQFGSSFIINNRVQNYQQSGENVYRNSGFSTTQQGTSQQNFWRSGTYKFRIQGIDAGDVNNDGRTETIIISDHAVHIFQAENNRFTPVTRTAENRINSYIAVDVADINNNGTPEIFVTSIVPDKNRIKSFVIEYDGSGYTEIAGNLEWYFRVVTKNPMERDEQILLGQKQEKGKDPFSSPIYEMRYQGGEYVPESRAISEEKCNVLGVAYGDITNNGKKEYAAFTQRDYIRILNNNSGQIWKSLDKYGGSINSFTTPTDDPTDTDHSHFLPMRLKLADTNQDGKLETITANNFDVTMNLLSNFRKFKKGHMESLFWNGVSLSSYWKTQAMRGRISDFFIGDFDNDGQKELVVCKVGKEGGIAFTEAQSYLVAYDI